MSSFVENIFKLFQWRRKETTPTRGVEELRKY